MKTIVINTSKEAKNTKLDTLFKAPFDHNSLLWIESELCTLGESALQIKESLLNESDAVDRDYQLIVLVDLHPFPYGNDKNAVFLYEQLMERYMLFTLVEKLHGELNLSPKGVCFYFVNSAKTERGLDPETLAKNPREQEREAGEKADRKKESLAAAYDENGDLVENGGSKFVPAAKRVLTPQDLLLMDIFSWTEKVTATDFSWQMKISVSGEESLDFSEVYGDTARSIKVSDNRTDVLTIALKEVMAPVEESPLSCIGRVPFQSVSAFISRENEQIKLEGFFCLFANVFSCVQEKKLFSQWIPVDSETIRELLIAALKKYKYFSEEENIKVEFEPIAYLFEKRKEIFEKRKEEARKQSEFKAKSEDEVAEIVMGMYSPASSDEKKHKLYGLDRNFHALVEKIFHNYDKDVIQKQNNHIVKSCLEGLWSWRDKQNSESFHRLVSGYKDPDEADESKSSRDSISFIQEEYEAHRDELIDLVTDAENKLASNRNILLETKDLVLAYGDWMRKGKASLISFIGAIFTILATAFPYFYTEYNAVDGKLGVMLQVMLVVGFLAFLYSVAASIYITYIRKQKLKLIYDLDQLRSRSEEERKESIKALYRYYNDTVIEAETLSLLWREIERKDRENAKKGIKRNYHVNRLKSLAKQVERFITMLKIDVAPDVTATAEDVKQYEKLQLQINGEQSYFEGENRRVYCFLPEKGADLQSKGEKEEA